MALRKQSRKAPRRFNPRLLSAIESFGEKHGLSARRREMLAWIAAGQCTAEAIAERLELSDNTVHNHFKLLMADLGTNSKAGILAMFIDHLLQSRPDRK